VIVSENPFFGRSRRQEDIMTQTPLSYEERKRLHEADKRSGWLASPLAQAVKGRRQVIYEGETKQTARRRWERERWLEIEMDADYRRVYRTGQVLPVRYD
jgi:hypothetical protein